MLQYFINFSNDPTVFICALMLLAIISYWYWQFINRKKFTDSQIAVFTKMVNDGMILVIRLSASKFQIIYNDGHAINIWHPDFIEFFSFMENNEILNIYQIVGKRSKMRNGN